MIPTTALAILIGIVIVCSLTMLLAIWQAIITRLKSPKKIDDEKENGQPNIAAESTIPLTTGTPARTPTPEAESPPPLASEELEKRMPFAKAANLYKKQPKTRDSTHEIIDMYGGEGKSSAPASHSTPSRTTKFAEAPSKWAYFGRHEDYHVV